MSKYEEENKKIHDNTDFRRNFAGVTNEGEFVYKEHGGNVPAGLEYHVHYTNTKNEVFMSGGSHDPNSSKIIEKVGGSESLFKRYTSLSTSTKEPYPKAEPRKPSESDYRLGTIKRYFAQIQTTINGDVFEISQDDFENQNNLFNYIDFDWKISGTFDEVVRENQITINFVNDQLPGIDKKLNPTSLWQAPKNSPESLEKKISLLKNG